MFDSSDSFTHKALLELRDIHNGKKPVIVWIGAGASRWAGYPTWNELAEKLHSQFIKYETYYDSKAGAKALGEQALPSVFSLCKKINSNRYFEVLSGELSTKALTPTYSRLITLLRQISPLAVVTTNIDRSLESNLGSISTYQNSNIEFARKAISSNQSFVYKLHGCTSSLETSIWTDEDYEKLIADDGFIENLTRLLECASIVFIGYSMRDKYILDILSRNQTIAKLLGDGPHFLVTSKAKSESTPKNVREIHYLTDVHSDHRGAMAILDLLRTDTANPKDQVIINPQNKVSGIYIPDYLTYGTWITSQSLTFSDAVGVPKGNATIGNGFVQSELPNFVSTALHDLLVGLICFDRIFFPFHGLGKLYDDLGAAAFWELVSSDVFRFVWKTSDLAIVFGVADPMIDGSIACLSARSPANPNSDRTLSEVLFAQLPAESDSDERRANLLTKFEKITIKFDDTILSKHPVLAQGALLSPRLRTSIGLSDAILPSRIPNWFVFPVLRVAMVVQDAEICRILGASAAKMPFGSDSLANAAYGITSSTHSASDFANYVVGGRFKADLGAMIIKQPELLKKILHFRDTSEGCQFRAEIFALLDSNEGGEFIASVNSMLKNTVPLDVLERARDHFVDVHFSPEHVSVFSGHTRVADPFLPWRKRSAETLRAICDAEKIKMYDFCPCGSGDKLKFCCGALFKN